MALTVLFRVRLRFRPAYPFYPSGAKIQTSFGTAGSRRVASFLTALVRRFEGPISLVETVTDVNGLHTAFIIPLVRVSAQARAAE